MTTESLLYQDVNDNPAVNRAFLSQGVKGKRCLMADKVSYVSNVMDPRSFDALIQIVARLFADEELGTIELYDNMAFNAFFKRGGKVVGYFIYRPEAWDVLVTAEMEEVRR